ncbi:MAG: phosphatase PAP2 family protein [Lachnospira pectinoschiza]
MVNASLILCILICLSTMFLKQHSVYDVIGGIVLMVYVFYALHSARKKYRSKVRS